MLCTVIFDICCICDTDCYIFSIDYQFTFIECNTIRSCYILITKHHGNRTLTRDTVIVCVSICAVRRCVTTLINGEDLILSKAGNLILFCFNYLPCTSYRGEGVTALLTSVVRRILVFYGYNKSAFRYRKSTKGCGNLIVGGFGSSPIYRICVFTVSNFRLGSRYTKDNTISST